jgi:hypothetical protein
VSATRADERCGPESARASAADRRQPRQPPRSCRASAASRTRPGAGANERSRSPCGAVSVRSSCGIGTNRCWRGGIIRLENVWLNVPEPVGRRDRRAHLNTPREYLQGDGIAVSRSGGAPPRSRPAVAATRWRTLTPRICPGFRLVRRRRTSACDDRGPPLPRLRSWRTRARGHPVSADRRGRSMIEVRAARHWHHRRRARRAERQPGRSGALGLLRVNVFIIVVMGLKLRDGVS